MKYEGSLLIFWLHMQISIITNVRCSIKTRFMSHFAEN